MALVAGTRLGHYEVMAPLGAGGMGEVYRARDTRLDRTVAIKLLPPRVAHDPERRARFEREAKTISFLNHPHICTLFDVGEEEGSHFLVMELLEGESLADRLQRGPLPLDQVVKYGAQVADALDCAHKQGIVHRDLKPGNVMLTRSGAKLLDFGLARSTAEASLLPGPEDQATEAKPLTAAGTVLGTYQYIAPEQLAGAEAGPRTDIFALGTVLYEMATGRRAFEGKSKTSLIAAILSAQPAPISSLQAEVPPALDHVVRKCLEKEPDDRWQSAHDVASELRWIADLEASRSGVSPGVPPHRQRPGWLITLSAGLALAALAFWLGRRTLREDAAKGTPPAVTRTVIELPTEAPLAVGAAAVGFDSTLVALSPDGRWLVYVGRADGVTRLYRRAVDRFDGPQPIAGTEGAIHAFFSPDSRHLGFLTDDRVKRVSIEGDDLRVLCSALSPVQGSWTRDGSIFFAEQEGLTLKRIPAGGGEVETIRAKDTLGRLVYFGEVLPDGKAVLATDKGAGVSGDYGTLFVVDVASGRSKVLLESGYDPRYIPPGQLVFARGGGLMAVGFDAARREVTGPATPVMRGVAMDSLFVHAQVAFSESGLAAYVPGSDRAIGRLARVDRRGRVDLLPAPPAAYGQIDLSPDGTKLAVHVADVSDYVWIWDLERKEGRRLTESAPAGWPIWGPAGDSVLTTTWRPGTPGGSLESRRLDGRETPRMLWKSGLGYGPGAGSWVGTTLTLGEWAAEGARSGVLSTSGTPSVAWDDTLCYFGAISRDGRWLACYRGGQVYLRSLSDRAFVRQVSTDGGHEPRWCRACDALFFRKANRWLATSVSLDPEPRWGPPRVVFETDFLDTDGYSYDVSPDGQYLYVVKSAAPDERRKIHFVTGWSEELERLVTVAR